ncbi:MAG: hypothetical protein LUF30_06425, partial [Lachnospiraceae bacterium]|nr:hypothetical protein [Lachnospiraceae bacterium]
RARALQYPERKFPIVVIISKEDEDGMMDEDWLGQFRVSDFTRTVWRYAHVLTCYEKVGRLLLERLSQNHILMGNFAESGVNEEKAVGGSGRYQTGCCYGRTLRGRKYTSTIVYILAGWWSG